MLQHEGECEEICMCEFISCILDAIILIGHDKVDPLVSFICMDFSS